MISEREMVDINGSAGLLARWEKGDEAAAAEIFDRYTGRLIALAQSRLSVVMRRRVEAEDVVQSAYRSFFRNAEAERYTIEHQGQLWGLLAAITINKLRTQVKHHQAQKRDVGAEASMTSSQSCYGLAPIDIARDPTGDDAAILVEEYSAMVNGLSDLQRDVFELYLQNQSNDQIANSVKRSPRTVRRALEEVRALLEERLG